MTFLASSFDKSDVFGAACVGTPRSQFIQPGPAPSRKKMALANDHCSVRSWGAKELRLIGWRVGCDPPVGPLKTLIDRKHFFCRWFFFVGSPMWVVGRGG